MESLSLIVPFVASIISSAAAIVAVVGLARVISREVPTVEFLVRHKNGRHEYELSVSNPTHRLLVLDYVEVLSPGAECVIIRRKDAHIEADIERIWEDLSSECKEKKNVFLQVPAGQTRHLEIQFKNVDSFNVNFRIHWSKGLPLLDRRFATRKVKLDSGQIEKRKLAAKE